MRTGGPAPDGSYAVIGFVPGDALADYRDVDWIHISGAGADGMLRAMRAANIQPALITRTVGQMGRQIGEYVLSYWLADLQKHAVRRTLQAERNWDVASGTPQLIGGRRALILGTGGIGSRVARVLSALGADCIGLSRTGRPRDGFKCVMAFDDLPNDLADIDLVIGALPLTDQTHEFINADLFKRMTGALFINVGRGATAHIPDMVSALDEGYLRHAVLDVVPMEPLPADDPLWSRPGVTITPHVSGLTLPEDSAAAFIAAYRALERGEQPDLIVDPEAGY